MTLTRRTRLKTRTPLRRRKRLSPKRRRPRRSSRIRDAAYMAFVRALPCRLAHLRGCTDPTEAHHASVDHGLGQKGSDRDTVPLCRRCHREWTSHSGWFGDPTRWTKEYRRMVAAMWIERTRDYYAALTGGAAGEERTR